MLLKDFFTKLATFDWYYDYSDDHRTWERGAAEYVTIRSISRESGAHLHLYCAWREYMFTGEPWNTPKAPKPELEDFLVCSKCGKGLSPVTSPEGEVTMGCSECKKI